MKRFFGNFCALADQFLRCQFFFKQLKGAVWDDLNEIFPKENLINLISGTVTI